jgi:uncharacterized membrane protein
MSLLIAGLILWIAAHFFPAMAPYKRKRLIAKMGLIPYKISFALVIISSIVLMVFGWRSIVPMQLYQLPQWTHYITLALVLISFILFVAAQVKTNIKRVLRHPQLTALVLWSIGHLLVNGDSRSLVLFLGLLIWAKLQVVATNKRDGKRELPEKMNIKNDIFTVIGGVTVFIIMIFAHPYITGISIL